MILAELVVRHTRHGSPVRRVAVERFTYPEASAPYAPGLLLGAVLVAHMPFVGEAFLERFDDLTADIAEGGSMPPRALRHRVQTDPIGLDRSEYRLVMEGETPVVEIDEHGPSLAQLVGALAALAELRGIRRRHGVTIVRRARVLEWTSGTDVARALLHDADPRVLSVRAKPQLSPEEAKALDVLGFARSARPTRMEVVAAFRRQARSVHPDHGGLSNGAGERMAELSAARRVLLGTS